MANIKDTYIVNLGTGNTQSYQVLDGNNVIYNGKAFKYPDARNIEVDLTHIVRDYLSSEIELYYPSLSEFTQQVLPNYYKPFTIQTPQSASTIYFANDYDYNNGNVIGTGSNKFMSKHIRNNMVADTRQYIPMSIFMESGRYNIYNSNRFIAFGDNTTATTYYTQVSPTQTPTTIIYDNSYNSISVKVVNTCADYVVYYQNALGGWDWLLLSDVVNRTDKIDSVYYNTNFNSKNINTQFKNKYQNTITPKWECFVSRLSDDEAARMYNLYTSQCIVLHNLKDNKMYRVNVTNTDVRYNTYRGNGKHRADYVIELEASNYYIKR